MDARKILSSSKQSICIGVSINKAKVKTKRAFIFANYLTKKEMDLIEGKFGILRMIKNGIGIEKSCNQTD